MKQKLKYIFLFLIAVVLLQNTSATTFIGKAPAAVLTGQKFRLVYSIDEKGSDFRLPPINDLEYLMGPSVSSGTSMTIVNGQMTRTSNYSYTFVYKCNKPGKYTIPPATIVVNGNKIESNSITIEVVKGEDATQQQSASTNTTSGGLLDSDIFIKVIPSKRSVYKDEPIVLTTKLYVKTQVSVQRVSDQKIPDLKGFITQDLEHSSDQKYETVNGQTYVTVTLVKKLVFPQKTGKLIVDPTEVEFSIRQRVARQRSRSIFDDFFDTNYRTIKKWTKSKPLTINVKSLPGNEPNDFSGIVGDVSMSTSITKTSVKTNDGITLKVTVSGVGNHKLMSNPKLEIPSDFDLFDPKVNNNFSITPQGMRGTKTYEYLIIPRHSGEFEIPAITLSYFDLKAKRYKQLTSKSYIINVEKGSMEENPTTTTVPYSASREELKYLGKDIRYIKTAPISLLGKDEFLFGSMLYFILLIIPSVLFLLFVLILRKRNKENANYQLVKNKKANKLARKRLKIALSLLKKNEKEAFHDEVLRALWGYMGDKLTLPVAQLSKENASTLMSNFEVKPEAISKFMEILDTCEFARYAPSTGSAEMDQLYNETIETIALIENQIKK